ncbi:MAG: hypothetical protein DIU79_05640 [Actinobacteria bacterium]|nr:MAG: hypothetical protein DIU79_05640 [Actinomycetota bacterium]
MRGVVSVGGRRRVRATIGMVAALAVGFVLGVAPATPAAATSHYLPGGIFVDCVVLTKGNTYRAVFGYYNNTPVTATIPKGPFNYLWPRQADGVQVTRFKPGRHHGVFATPPIPRNKSVTWVVGIFPATATAKSPQCGPNVELPAEGNGLAPLLVLAGGVVAALIGLRLRRLLRRS